MDEYKRLMGMMRGELRGDFSRDTFDEQRQFSRIYMQQGRVQLDADFNEQASITVHYLRALAVDLMGPHAAPADADGQERDDFKVELAGENLDHFTVNPGIYYVNGIRCVHRRSALEKRKEVEQYELPKEYQNCLIYLDVWERHIAAVEEDLIRETALNGPDTATRAKIEWQVKTKININTSADELKSYTAFMKELDEVRRPGKGQLRAQARRREAEDLEPCLTAPEARYRGPENQLYRVEIHKGGQSKTATFKWSRENGSVYFPIVKPVAGRTVTVAHLGRDARFGLKPADWVELIDDEEALTPERPPLLQVEFVAPDTFEVTLQEAPTSGRLGTEMGKHPYLRRWDHKSDSADGIPVIESAPSSTKWIELEDGIQIQFLKGDTPRYGVGDYWLIPARTITGDVEWPGSAANPEFSYAHGTLHHYAPLALIARSQGRPTPRDLRRQLKPLW